MSKFYAYRGCTTCKKALKFLNQHQIEYEEIAIVTQPPSLAELKKLLKLAVDGQVKKLFNTSGEMYRSLDMKNKLPTMSEEEALELLSKHGKLIKRPLFIGETHLVGFKQESWEDALLA